MVERLSCGFFEARLGCACGKISPVKVAVDGHRTEFEELVCRDDGLAVYHAKRLVLDHDVEVWNGNRFVFRLECKRR
jgi:hypothetical protein